MNKILTGLLLFLICTPGISQDSKKKKTSFRKELHASTKEQIHQLKNGVLLVRLKTKKNAITALRKIGANAKADLVEKKQAEFNIEIITAFGKNFNFCPTYFFYSDYSDTIRGKKMGRVIFLNAALQPDPSIKFEGKHFLIAEFGPVEQDTAKSFSYTSYEPDGDFSVQRVDHYNGGPNFNYDGLIIRNDQFIQLRHPFPYFVRTRDPRPNKKKLNSTVKRMNKKLTSFYNKNK